MPARPQSRPKSNESMDISIPPGRVAGELTPPCSKSYAQRVLAASLLANGTTTVRNIDYCDDTRSALRCIRALGAEVSDEGSRLLVTGGLAPRTAELHVGESGLSARLFTPLAALCGTPVTVTGTGTLLRRPMMPMVETLRSLGVAVRDGGGFLPIEVCGPLRGGEAFIDGSLSSQFVTGLLLALPLAGSDTTLRVANPVSLPYMDMTIETAAMFGVEIFHNSYEEFFIEGRQRYMPADIEIEGDWSSAAIMLAAGAIAGEMTLHNVPLLSKQADTAIATALVRAGAQLTSDARSVTAAHRPLAAFEFDATHCPDLFPALAALAAAADGESVITGTRRLEHKESNRAVTLREQYARLGIEIDISTENTMKIRGGEIRPATVDACGDHRIAMSLAVSALRCTKGAVTITGAECVAKSYPDFFRDLEAARSTH